MSTDYGQPSPITLLSADKPVTLELAHNKIIFSYIHLNNRRRIHLRHRSDELSFQYILGQDFFV